MPHFRLRQSDSLDDRDSLECDKATREEALLEFGHRLTVILTLEGDAASEYVMQQRDYDEANYRNAPLIPVYVARPEN